MFDHCTTIETLQKAFDKVFEEATAQAQKAYEEAIEPAKKAFFEAKARALRACSAWWPSRSVLQPSKRSSSEDCARLAALMLRSRSLRQSPVRVSHRALTSQAITSLTLRERTV